MQDRPLSLISSSILSVCFIAALVLPVAETFLHFGPRIQLDEKRKLQSYPRFEWTRKILLAYPARFEAAFNDHFGLREFLVRTQARLKFYWLGMSPSSKVVLGRDGWLYLSESIDEYRGVQRLPVATTKKWVQEIEYKKRFLTSNNTKYLVVIAPNKETVYPEFLPPNIRQIRNNLYIDDLLKALPADAQYDILDLRQPLISAKAKGRLYFKTDSHWSQLGAALASDSIIERVSVWFPDLRPANAFQELRTIDGKSGDLAEIMSLADQLREERLILGSNVRSLRPAPLRWESKAKGILENQAVESTGGRNQRRAILTGDSFTGGLKNFLPVHFRRTLKFRPYLSYKDPLFKALVASEKPDVYLEVLVDRHLINPPRVLAPEKIPKR